MRESKDVSIRGGVNTLGLLQVAFIVLKLCKVIDWKWTTVLIPLWIELGVIVLFFLIVAIIAIIGKRNEN